MMSKILLIFLSVIFVYGCIPINETDYFNGSIKVVDPTNVNIKEVKLTDLKINLPIYDVYIYDSLIINSGINKNIIYNIINMNTKESIGNFCHRGKAQNEILETMPISSIYKVRNELKTIIVDPNKSQLYEWNITKSIHTQTTIFDTIIPFKSLSKAMRPYDYVEYMNDSTLITYTQSCLLNPYEKEPELPFIELRAFSKDSLYKKIYVFNAVFHDNKPLANLSDIEYDQITPSYRFYSSRTSIRPDHLFIVQSMLYLGQLNIIDVTTGEIIGIRLKGTPDFSLFKNARNINNFYFCGGLWTTNDRIFVGYNGGKEERNGNVKFLYEFDWAGNIINIYNINRNVDELIYDKVNRLFYCFNSSEEKLFSFKIDE